MIMSKFYLSLILLILAFEISAQRPIPQKEFTQEEYLKQSKNLNTAGWLAIISGMTVALIPLGFADFNEPLDDFGLIFGSMTISTIAIAAGIPLLIKSGSAKRKAARLGIQTQTFQMLQGINIVSSSAPSLALQITF